MVESSQGEVRISRRSWGDPEAFKHAPNKVWHSSEWPTSFSRSVPLLDARSTPLSPMDNWSITPESSVINNPFSLEVIAKEIDDEFKDMQGEPVYTFGHQPTPGLGEPYSMLLLSTSDLMPFRYSESIREAIHRNTSALIDKINMLEAQLDMEENRKTLAKKKIREAISEARKDALECRIKTIENLLVEYLPTA
ncbi:hypothetical protein ACEPAF_411 [Sanghuangporus sanghuang]|uniref:Uncharacterized protein n=1 Tax=Sanghuangporus baumii TaxID=108892 RepID=A0A9Q5HXA8_SANBA|nr:hypothetical protein A7U60_g5257 [Sanghuangporus baumii]